MEPIFFASGAEVRGWLEAHGGAAGEVLIGFYKKGAALVSTRRARPSEA